MSYVFAGAERLDARTRQTWMDKFGLRILEGYGATETGPVLATDTPKEFRAGTIGRLLPGIEHLLEPVPGLARGGRLLVRGPNVMAGRARAVRRKDRLRRRPRARRGGPAGRSLAARGLGVNDPACRAAPWSSRAR